MTVYFVFECINTYICIHVLKAIHDWRWQKHLDGVVRGDLRSNREEIQTAVLAVDYVMKESKYCVMSHDTLYNAGKTRTRGILPCIYTGKYSPALYNVSCDKIHVLVWPVWPPLSADEIKTGRIFTFYCLWVQMQSFLAKYYMRQNSLKLCKGKNNPVCSRTWSTQIDHIYWIAIPWFRMLLYPEKKNIPLILNFFLVYNKKFVLLTSLTIIQSVL